MRKLHSGALVLSSAVPVTSVLVHFGIHRGGKKTVNMSAMHIPKPPGFGQMLKDGARVSYNEVYVLKKLSGNFEGDPPTRSAFIPVLKFKLLQNLVAM